MYTIGQISKKFNLSRSTLIYYDKLKLLSPSSRSISNYRLYTEKDVSKMKKIQFYRKAGVPLEDIKQLLISDKKGIESLLEKRLEQLDEEISALKMQQSVIADILKNKHISSPTSNLTKEQWVNILQKTGLDEKGMRKWHMAFESSAPEAHENFLKKLGIENNEIKRIREWSKDHGVK